MKTNIKILIFFKKISPFSSLKKTNELRIIYIGLLLLILTAGDVKSQHNYDFSLSSSPSYSYSSFNRSNTNGNKEYLTNIFKTDVLSIIDGDLPLIYEHRFTGSFALEGGVGLILPYNNDFSTLPISGENNKSFKNDRFGYSFLIAPRVYFAQSSKNYMALMVRYRRYDQLAVTEYGLGKGWVWLLGDKYPIDAAVFASLSFQKAFGNNNNDNNFRFKNNSFNDDGHVGVFALSFVLKFGVATK